MHSVFCTSRLGFFTLIKSIAFRSQKKKKLLDSRQSKQDRENNKSRLNYLFFPKVLIAPELKIPLYVAAHVTLNCS